MKYMEIISDKIKIPEKLGIDEDWLLNKVDSVIDKYLSYDDEIAKDRLRFGFQFGYALAMKKVMNGTMYNFE